MLSSKREWKTRIRIITPVYVTLVCGMLIYMLLFTLFEAIQERKEYQVTSARLNWLLVPRVLVEPAHGLFDCKV